MKRVRLPRSEERANNYRSALAALLFDSLAWSRRTFQTRAQREYWLGLARESASSLIQAGVR